VRALVESNPDYASVLLIRADWDKHRRTKLTEDLKIPRRSTLLMFKDGQEIARVIAQTNKDAIEEMFKAVVS